MLINSETQLGKFIIRHKVALMFLMFTSIFYGIYNDDYYGVFVWFFLLFIIPFFLSNFGKNAKIFKISSIIICLLYFILYPFVDILRQLNKV